MSTLKLTPHYFNSYEAAYNTLSNKADFEDAAWNEWARKGELDMYIAIMANADKIANKEKFYKDYNWEYSDTKTRVAALYNEIFADRTNNDTERTRYVTDAEGNYVTDETGNPMIEKFTASDYDYSKSIIDAANNVNYQKYLIQQEKERKESLNGFVKVMGDIGSVFTGIGYGLANQLDNIFNSVAAIGNGVSEGFKGNSFTDAIVNTNASNTWRVFENAGVQDWIVDFERKYTHIRDLNGNYAGFGGFVGGVSTSLGQMLPSMATGWVGGKVAGAFGASTSVASTISKATSTLVFYQGATAGNVRDIYQQMSKDNVTPSSAVILANASVKSALQWGVEIGLGRLLGGTSIDNLVFGRSVSAVGGKSLAKAGASRVFKDFVQEGLEEVLQDTSDFLVDKAFGLLIEENFGEITDLSWQSLVDSFFIGGIASFAGSAMRIATTKRIETPNVDVNADVNTDTDSEVKIKKLGKLASWEYGLNMQSFMQNFATIQKLGDNVEYTADKGKGKQYAAAFTEMYAAYRMISSIYTDIGEERFKAANNVLTKITEMINSGKFNSTAVKNASTEVFEVLRGMETDAIELAKDKLKAAGITKTVDSIERGEDVSTSNFSDSTRQELERMFAGDNTIDKIVLTKDGNNVVNIGNIVFIPMNYMSNANAEIIYSTLAEQKLVENIIDGTYKGFVIDDITALFRQVGGKNDATTEEAIYNLVFNDSFFRIVLSTANKDTFDFVASLIDIEQSVVPKKLRDAVYKQKLNTVIENMKKSLTEYLVNQQFADYRLDIFTKDQQRKIAKARWCRDLYSRVTTNSTFKKLNENDWNVLNARVNSMPVQQSEKDKLIKNLHSEHADVRTAAMNRIATVYFGIFTSKYDGKIYMPDVSIPNRTFNSFLQQHGLTIETLSSTNLSTDVRNTVTQLYGDVNQDTVIKFRQEQFSKACNNKYTFRYNKQGKLGVYEATTNKQVGFSAYNAQADSLLSPTALDKRTTVERSNKKNYLVKDLLNSAVDAATASYLSIDDVISDPSLLNEQHQANIQLKYGEVNIENTFMYLREHFVDVMKTTTVVALADGSYAFADIRPMKAALKVDNVKIDNRTKISQLIKPAYLYGRLENIKIKLTNDRIVAEYNAGENTIYVNSTIAEKGGDLLTFAFLHEFQHAIQVENGMNIGMNAAWINLKNLSKTARKNIIADVRKHRPELFEGVSKGSDTEAKIVNDFVYFSSGESTAIGIDASKLLDFYPTIIRQTANGTTVQFPWGTKHSLTNGLSMSLVAQLGDFDIKMSDKEYRYYKALALEAYNELTGKIDTKRVLSRFEGNTYDDFINDFLKILAVSDDREFIRDLYWYLSDELPYDEDTYESDYDDELAECNNLLHKRLSELEIFAKGIQDVDKVIDVKSYTPLELKELFFKYNTDIAIEPFAENAFNKFETLSSIFGSDVKVTNWHSKIRPDSAGFVYGNLIRYSADEINNSRRTRTPELLLHEVLHFITEPLIQMRSIDEYLLSDDVRNCIQQLQYLLNHEVSRFESTPYKHRVRNVSEFVAGRAHRSFLSNLQNNSDNLSMPFKRTIESIVNKPVNTYYEAYIALTDALLSYTEIGAVYRTYYNIRTAKYYTYTYPDSHNGITEAVYADGNSKFYRLDDNGQRIYMDDVNFELVENSQSSLGPSNNMSIRASTEAEASLIKLLSDRIRALTKSNKQLTSQDLETVLKNEFPFAPIEIISELVAETFGDARTELEELNTASIEHIDKSTLKPVIPRASTKRKVENIKRETTTKKRYASQRGAAGTNLEKFGYVGKYKRSQISPEMQSFIVNATEDIDTVLWEKIKSGKITTRDVMDYFRDTKVIDNKTFALINRSFFHNDKIKTFEQLQEFILFKTPKYYAMRAIAKSFGYGDALLANTNPALLDKFVEIVNKDTDLKKLYDQIVDRYYKYKGSELVISEKNLRRLWMRYFDGSAQSAGYLATVAKAGAINKWLITGEGSTKATRSLDDEIGEDMNLSEKIADTSATDAFEEIFYSSSREERIEEIMKIVGPRYLKKLMSKGATQSQAIKKFNEKWSQLREMDDKEFAKQYAIIVKNMSEEEINNLFAKQLIAESAGIDVSQLDNKQLEKLEIVAEQTIPAAVRPSSAIVNNIRSIARTIKSNLSSKDKARFLKENSDIFTDNLTVKQDLLTQKNDKGEIRYIDSDTLIPLEDRVRKLSKDVRAKVYQSSRSLDFKKQMDKQLEKLKRENAKLVDQLAKGKTTQAVTYEISDETITIDTKKEIPSSLKRILAHEFNKVVKSKTQYLIEGEQSHIQTNLNKFINDNAELLQALTQTDVDEIVDFYMNSEILPSTNKARQYSAIQVYLMAYLIKGNKLGQFTLSEEQANSLNTRLENIVSLSAANLSNWKAAMKMLKPAEVIAQSLARSCDIEFSVADIDNLIKAAESGDVEKLRSAKTRMYNNGLRQYNGNKRSFLDKVVRFERLAMLSSPGTWMRNKVSNALVTGGNLASEQVGKTVSNLIEKLFPGKKWRRDNQYKLVGTKVTSEVQTFIKTNILDNGLLELIRDGISKYDVRRNKLGETTTDESLTDLIVRSVKNQIFQENTFKSSALNKAQNIILKGLSDDKSIDKAAIRYFGKMLVENDVNIRHGLTVPVINTFAEAYKLAAYDYMHKTNFFNKIESQLRQEWGDKAFFVYKQLFPFAAASWNWFVEGLNYTPVGLAKAIINFAKLEDTIEKMDTKRQKGEQIPSSRFAEYLARRNIGKGVIGSIGFAIGACLVAWGFAGVDEEDDKYKLFINMGDERVAVDISDIFGTQGIMLGITLFSAKKDGDWMNAVGETLDTMFNDSTFSEVFNSFRYNDTFGEWLVDQPFAFLNMFVPNFIKTLSSVANKYKIKYSSGIKGHFERLAVQAVPGLAYAFPKQMDPYTGEKQVAYKMWFVTGLANKLLPFKVYPYNVSEAEKEAISVGVKKGPLTGQYEIDGEKVKLTAEQIENLNEYYGKLNKKELEKLMSNKSAYRVWDEKKQKYVELKYSRMTDAQKKTVIERIMSDNGQVAKVYILTSSGWKYYTSESEYKELKKLGITNVYKKTNKLDGFVAN